MNRNGKRLLTSALLVLPLLVPVEPLKARKGADQPKTEMVRAVRRVDRARINRDQAEAIAALPALQGVVAVRGRLIRPYDGNSLWELSNGGYAIFDYEPTPQAMQTWTKDMGEGIIYFMVCYCPNSDPNKDDGCKFENPNNPTNPGRCMGPTTCCTVVDGLILDDGSYMFI